MRLDELINRTDLHEIARQAIEDELIIRRDSRISVMRNNGLCVKEFDGSPSDVIRMSHEEALVIGLQAIINVVGY